MGNQLLYLKHVNDEYEAKVARVREKISRAMERNSDWHLHMDLMTVARRVNTSRRRCWDSITARIGTQRVWMGDVMRVRLT